MAKKKVSDTIEQQRKARAEFLKLKQMQSGEIAPEPKPSEVAVLPKTPKEKIANFWFHYKTTLIVSVILFAVLTVFVVQCVQKVDSDLDIVYFSYTTPMDSEVTEIAKYFEAQIDDLNGDGKVKVNVINCSFNPKTVTFEYRNTMLQKVQTALSANSKAMLYITDSESIEYFNNLNVKSEIFEGEPIKLPQEIHDLLDDSEFGKYLPDDLQISCRNIKGTLMEREKNIEVYYDASKKIIENLKNK